ncbi:MAG: hypothetical protein JW779_04705 [Candidatus Thorarchaeota archaeon]|nr:hypothetical protein [Candidatus Thorarchaeota archaeon]
MRYALGVLIGALIPGIIFMGAAAIKIAGIGADAVVRAALWSVYTLWFLLSIVVSATIPIIVYFAKKDLFREFLIYEAGGFGFFSPLWLFFATEISGNSWTSLFIYGITQGLIGPGPEGNLVGIDISNSFLIPILILSMILGIIFLNPSFVAKHSQPSELPELTALKKTSAPTEEEEMEAEMPDVAPPVTTVDSVSNLRDILIELGTTDPIINLILNAGIGTTTEFVATSPDQLANLTGIDKRAAETLLISVQKKLWFSDI